MLEQEESVKTLSAVAFFENLGQDSGMVKPALNKKELPKRSLKKKGSLAAPCLREKEGKKKIYQGEYQ